MRIGSLAAATGVSVRSLRYYEEQGLLQAGRSASGQRFYLDGAVERVKLIRQLFAAGLCSSTMVDLIPCMSDSAERTPLLADRLRSERDRISRDIANLRQIRFALEQVIVQAESEVSPAS